MDNSSAIKAIANCRERKDKIVFTNGCFDILHAGHARYLAAARELGDCLVVGLNSDASVRRIKGSKRPIVPQAERAELLIALACVDFVLIFDEDTPLNLIEAVRPDVLVKGGDWKVEDIVGGPFVSSYGGTVASLPFHEGYSTTNIIEKIRESLA
ncbi:MAG: D-glycero-beta-D-manno-heptose 1-phosphate adenylyltransferase [Bdellovibrionales bacterium]|nr:D-glycero-beta-D-manno-heptose 1-phosphate adenylyltransferase [Bdellovibrionales bacterium]